MRHSRIALGLAGLAALVLLAGVGVAQEKPKTPPQGAPPGMPQLPTPGAEQELLKKDVGTWDATVEVFEAPGSAAMTSKGVETATLGCGGLCLIIDFKGDLMGMPFTGHGTTQYDSTKKKYVSTWMDSMSQGLGITTATYDPAKKTLSGTMEGPDMSGQPGKMKSVIQWQDADTRVFTLSAPAPDGKDVAALKITYKRRK